MMTGRRELGPAIVWLGAAVLLGWVAAGGSFAQDESPPADAPGVIGAALSQYTFNFFTNNCPYGTTGKAKFIDGAASWSRDPETGHWLYVTPFIGAAIPTQAGADQAATFSTMVVVDYDPEGGTCHVSSSGLYPFGVSIEAAQATFADATDQSGGVDTGGEDTGSDEGGVDTGGEDTGWDDTGWEDTGWDEGGEDTGWDEGGTETGADEGGQSGTDQGEQSGNAETCPDCGSPLGSNPNCMNCVLSAHDPTQ